MMDNDKPAPLGADILITPDGFSAWWEREFVVVVFCLEFDIIFVIY